MVNSSLHYETEIRTDDLTEMPQMPQHKDPSRIPTDAAAFEAHLPLQLVM